MHLYLGITQSATNSLLLLQIQAIQEIVSCTEKALKLVSDQIADEDHVILAAAESPVAPNNGNTSKVSPTKMETEPTPCAENSKPKQESVVPATSSKELQMYRALKGVMRVGLLAKGLLLKGDTDVQLIVLCAQKPSKSLLERVYNTLVQKIDVTLVVFPSFFAGNAQPL